MKLSRSVSYAVSVLLQLPPKPVHQPWTAARISRGCKFPPRFLYRVLRRLVDAGILTGISGPKGGYMLARPAARINLLDIVQAAEDKTESSHLEAANRKHVAAIRMLNELSDRNLDVFHQELAKLSLADLAGAGRKPGRKSKRPSSKRP